MCTINIISWTLCNFLGTFCHYSPLGFQPIWGILKPLMSVCLSVCLSVCVSVCPSVANCSSEMAGWIHLIFYSMMTHIPGMMPFFSDLEKIENWQFYGSFSYNFWPEFYMVQACSETVLRNGSMNSLETSQQHALYSRDDFHVFRFS